MPEPTSELEQSPGPRRRPAAPGASILWLDEVGATDTARVGGKASSLGELRRELAPLGVRVPNGFVTTVGAFRAFLEAEVPRRVWRQVVRGIPGLGGRAPSSGALGANRRCGGRAYRSRTDRRSRGRFVLLPGGTSWMVAQAPDETTRRALSREDAFMSRLENEGWITFAL